MSYRPGQTVTFTHANGPAISGKITGILQVGDGVSQVIIISLSGNLPEGVKIPNVVVGKIYDPRFLRDPTDTNAVDLTRYPRQLCSAEVKAYETLRSHKEVVKYLAPYYGQYQFKTSADPNGYCAILLGLCEGPHPFGLSTRIADSVVDSLRTIINKCHELGIANGDLAPRNLLVDPETGELRKVLDWSSSIMLGVRKAAFRAKCVEDMDALDELPAKLSERDGR